MEWDISLVMMSEPQQPISNPNTVAWLYLVLAGLLETVWAIGMKYTHGFTRLGPSIFTLAVMGVSFFLLGKALRTLPVGTGYAVWTGIGAVGTAIFGIMFFGEAKSAARIVCLLLIVLGILGLKLTSEGH